VNGGRDHGHGHRDARDGGVLGGVTGRVNSGLSVRQAQRISREDGGFRHKCNGNYHYFFTNNAKEAVWL
jgi:hypothetical protein